MKKENIITICRILLIILWVYAAGSKLVEHGVFVFSLNRQPLPGWSVPIVATALPITELAVALLLGMERYKRQGLLFSFLLMTVFTLYVGLALSGALGEIPCACGGVISKLGWKGHLVFNIAYTLIAWIGWRKSRQAGDKSSNNIVENQLI